MSPDLPLFLPMQSMAKSPVAVTIRFEFVAKRGPAPEITPLKITLDGTLPNIRPGLSAKAEITVADRPAALAVPLGSVTVREWPLKDGDIRRYTGSKARRQADALEEFGLSDG